MVCIAIPFSVEKQLIRYNYTDHFVPFHILTTMWLGDQGAHVRERLTANRSDLILQGGPNQHGTHKPRRTTRTNHSPPRLELQEPAQQHMVSRAQRETTKSKHTHPQFSATTRLAPGVGCGFLYFRSKTVLGLPVLTTSYSRHAVSTIQHDHQGQQWYGP